LAELVGVAELELDELLLPLLLAATGDGTVLAAGTTEPRPLPSAFLGFLPRC